MSLTDLQFGFVKIFPKIQGRTWECRQVKLLMQKNDVMLIREGDVVI